MKTFLVKNSEQIVSLIIGPVHKFHVGEKIHFDGNEFEIKEIIHHIDNSGKPYQMDIVLC